MHIRLIKRLIISVVVALPLLASCGGGNPRDNGQASSDGGKDCPLEYAQGITIRQYKDFTKVTIRNPWDTARNLQTLLLIPDSLEFDGMKLNGRDLPCDTEGCTVVRVPLKRTVVYSSVHQGLISELGAIDAIAGICDPGYVHQEEILARMSHGRIVDCGSSLSPDMEKMLGVKGDAILLSPYENSVDFSKLEQFGTPVVQCADYMEATPLGRAEWMRFFGMLFGKQPEASSLWRGTSSEYQSVSTLALACKERPTVLTDRIYGNVWCVPLRNSTTGRYIEDAGGKNPFADIKSGKGGIAQLSGEKVLATACNADFWLIRYHQNRDKTLGELGAEMDIYRRFDAFANGGVYGCNTAKRRFFEETPFHPQRLLAELAVLLHPELADSIPVTHRYYELMSR